jgi:hypothetical protein
MDHPRRLRAGSRGNQHRGHLQWGPYPSRTKGGISLGGSRRLGSCAFGGGVVHSPAIAKLAEVCCEGEASPTETALKKRATAPSPTKSALEKERPLPLQLRDLSKKSDRSFSDREGSRKRATALEKGRPVLLLRGPGRLRARPAAPMHRRRRRSPIFMSASHSAAYKKWSALVTDKRFSPSNPRTWGMGSAIKRSSAQHANG